MSVNSDVVRAQQGPSQPAVVSPRVRFAHRYDQQSVFRRLNVLLRSTANKNAQYIKSIKTVRPRYIDLD